MWTTENEMTRFAFLVVWKWHWRWLSSGLLCCVVWWKFTDVPEVLAASIIRIHWWWRQQTRLKCWQNSTRLHGATTQKTAIFIHTAVRTWNLTKNDSVLYVWSDRCECTNRTYFSVISTLGSRTHNLVQGIQHSSWVLLYQYRLYWNCKRNKRQSSNIHRSENCRISMLGCRAVVSNQNLLEEILHKVREVFVSVTFVWNFSQLTQYLISYVLRLT
jgi:hypothetical protein